MNIFKYLKQHNRLKVIISILNVTICVAIITFSSIAYAWFAHNEQVEASGMQISVRYDGSSISPTTIYALKFDGVNGAVAYEIDDEHPVSVQMSEYDCIFTDRNINTPLIIRVEAEGLKDFDKFISVSIPCKANYTNNQSSPLQLNTSEDSTDEILNYLSNVLVVRLGCYLKINGERIRDTFDPSNESDVVTIYEGSRDALLESDIRGKFVGEENLKTKEINLEIPYDTFSPYLDDEGKLIFFIELDYEDGLISNFLSHSEESETGEVEFLADLGIISLR